MSRKGKSREEGAANPQPQDGGETQTPEKAAAAGASQTPTVNKNAPDAQPLDQSDVGGAGSSDGNDGAGASPDTLTSPPEAEESEQAKSKRPEPDGIAVAALFAGGAAYYRALRLDERMPGIDVSWLAPGATIESADDSNLELIEERLMSLAAYARRAPEARAPALAMHLALARQRESGDLTEEETIAFTVFHKTLVQLDHFAAAEANRARQAHRKIPRAQPVDIEDTTLELVDEPLAKRRF